MDDRVLVVSMWAVIVILGVALIYVNDSNPEPAPTPTITDIQLPTLDTE